jgi:hypothetical protein
MYAVGGLGLMWLLRVKTFDLFLTVSSLRAVNYFCIFVFAAAVGSKQGICRRSYRGKVFISHYPRNHKSSREQSNNEYPLAVDIAACVCLSICLLIARCYSQISR